MYWNVNELRQHVNDKMTPHEMTYSDRYEKDKSKNSMLSNT